MTQSVLDKCQEVIKEREIWIPISRLYIQAPFPFGKVTFKAITKSMIDDWEARVLSKVTKPGEIESVSKGFERRRQQIQGLAVTTMKLEAESEQAHEIALDETDKSISILRFLSPANIHPAKVCYSAPFGTQHEDRYQFLEVEGGRIIGQTAGLTDNSRIEWNLSNDDLATWAPEINILSSILASEELTDFQEALLEALILYSRSSLAKQVSDKLIFILIALESIFLKDTGEPIQDAISLRMAYMQDVSVEKRRSIIANVKVVYKLRSSFIHHGHSISLTDIKTLSEFMMNAWLSLAALILLAGTDITKEGFFDYLENRRLAG